MEKEFFIFGFYRIIELCGWSSKALYFIPNFMRLPFDSSFKWTNFHSVRKIKEFANVLLKIEWIDLLRLGLFCL